MQKTTCARSKLGIFGPIDGACENGAMQGGTARGRCRAKRIRDSLSNAAHCHAAAFPTSDEVADQAYRADAVIRPLSPHSQHQNVRRRLSSSLPLRTPPSPNGELRACHQAPRAKRATSPEVGEPVSAFPGTSSRIDRQPSVAIFLPPWARPNHDRSSGAFPN